jgi:hypothetical protein
MPVTASTPLISLSSSGYADGLGRRQLEVDRESGEMIERLVVRPELTAFEHVLSARVARASLLKDDRFARPRKVAWNDEGRLTVTSSYVGGRRLSDVVDVAAAAGVIGGIDAAIGLLLELLPALSYLHSESLFAHGVLGAGRLTLTPTGSLVILDWVYGAPVEHLQLTRQRLWDELGVAAHPSPGPPRLDQASDLTQAAMIAASLVVGRPLCDKDYPSGIPALRGEIAEVAQIRGNQEFSRGIERFFDRSLPIRPRRVFSSADEALFELRMLVRNTIGIEACRSAFHEFLHEAESVDPELMQTAPKYLGPSHEHRIDEVAKPSGRTTDATKTQPVPVVKSPAKTDRQQPAPIPVQRFELERIAVERVEAERRAREDADRAQREKTDAERLERDLLERERAIKEAEQLQRLARDKAAAERAAREQAEAERIARAHAEAERIAREQAEAERVAREHAETEQRLPEDVEAEQHTSEQAGAADAETAAARNAEPTLEITIPVEPPSVEVPEPLEATPEPLVQLDGRRRRKKERSARARKDRLRSTSRSSAVEANPDERKSGNSWLVRPDHVRAFDPPVPAPKVPPEAEAPEPESPVSDPSLSTPSTATAAASSPNTIDAGFPKNDAPATVSSVRPTPPPAVSKPPAVVPTFQKIKLKAPEARAHGTITRASARPHRQTSVTPLAAEIYGDPTEPQESRGGILWKAIAAAVVIVMGGGYAALSFFSTPPAKAAAAAVAASTTSAAVPTPASTGGLEITTEPAGARVLVDGKAAGESPVTVAALTPGRHTVTVLAEAGTVKRTVKVEAGSVAKLEVSVFSGFAAISAPIILDVSENGRGLGTTENHVMLTPGHHELHLTNKELEYSTTASIDVEPGEVKQVKLDPKGAANINAQPWAEVWIDGTKVGETPLANLPLTLGSREIVFRNPQFGERKVMATITAGAPATVSVDFSK